MEVKYTGGVKWVDDIVARIEGACVDYVGAEAVVDVDLLEEPGFAPMWTITVYPSTEPSDVIVHVGPLVTLYEEGDLLEGARAGPSGFHISGLHVSADGEEVFLGVFVRYSPRRNDAAEGSTRWDRIGAWR